METFIIAFVILLIFFISAGIAFALDIIALAVNFCLLYAVVIRAYAEIRKENKLRFYIAGLGAGLVFYFLIVGNPLSPILVWGITSYLIESFIFAQIFVLAHHLSEKRRRQRKR